MAGHRRNQSRGSFSIFSFDTIRSFSRAGSRQAARIPSRDELHERAVSSLSYNCDPHNQPPSSPSPHATKFHSHVSSKPACPTHQENNGQIPGRFASSTITARALSARQKVSQILRPLSWSSLQKPFSQGPSCPRSVSTQLPKASSTSTVGRSVISAPTLTSTTNVEIARTECVHCGEISEAAFSQSTWDSQVDWVARTSVDKSSTSGHDSHFERAQPGKEGASPAGRTFRGGRMFSLGNALRARIKPSSLSNWKENALLPQSCPPASGDPIVQNTSSIRADPRYRVETLGHYRGKMKGFAWGSHIRRKSVNNAPNLLSSQQDPPLLGRLNDMDAMRSHTIQGDGDSAFGSLTRSFASAVDKLDFHSPLPHNASFLRSKSSFFNIKKGISDNNGHQELSQTEHEKATFASTSSLHKSDTTKRAKPHVVIPLRGGNPSTNGILAGRKIAPEPIVYSPEHNGYIPSKPVEGHPKGVHPLRMHPPSPKSTLAMKPQRAETPSQMSEDGSECISLEDAPIYSPSLGDLSQYARETPPSSKNAKLQPRKAVAIDTTPTRVFVKEKKHNSSLGVSLKKSSSALSLFSKGRLARVAAAADKGHRHGSRASTLPRTEGVALQPRDTNQKMGLPNEKQVKKSRSLHLGGLFKRESSSTLGPSTPRDRSTGFQPATPSPLRNVTRVRRSQSTAQESPPLLTKGAVQ
ncbi:uncharacterized protein A1O9_10761, partial [Exophiala aquamarina CBS 119918]